MNFIAFTGKLTIEFMRELGRISIFIWGTVLALRTPIYLRVIMQQLYQIGFLSLPVIGLTAVFTGAVLALQSYTGFSRFSAESSIPSVVALSVTRELGPVLAGLMLAGRVGAAIAAEIGTMKVTEQIDALATLNTQPMKYLTVPRVIAGIIITPFLVAIADIIGILGGYIVATYKLGFSPSTYIHNTAEILKTSDIGSGLLKAAIFGFIVTITGCYCGFNAKGGAKGVGNATKATVVGASIIILMMDYIITGLLF